MPDALPGQNYVNQLRDRRGNALGSATVEVIDAGTQITYYTTTTDDDGRYVIPLTGPLATRLLVNLRFSGAFAAFTVDGIALL